MTDDFKGEVPYKLNYTACSQVANDKLRQTVLSVLEEQKTFMFNYSDYNDYTVNYTVAQK